MPIGSKRYFLGIEGGATRSTLVLADADQNPVMELQGGPANIRLLSDRALAALLRGFAKQLPNCKLSGLSIGLAGARTDADLERIQQAASGLDDRIGEIETQEAALDELDAKLMELTAHLMSAPQSAAADADAAPAEPVQAAEPELKSA